METQKVKINQIVREDFGRLNDLFSDEVLEKYGDDMTICEFQKLVYFRWCYHAMMN